MRAPRSLLAAMAILLPSFVPFVGTHAAAASPALPRLTVGDVRVAEGNAGKIAVRVPFDLDAPAATKVSVYWKISGGTATGGTAKNHADYATVSKTGIRTGNIAIAAKKTEAFVSITVFGDTVLEPDETVFVDVTSVIGATVESSRGTLTIVNDDAQAGTLSHRAMASADPSAPTLSIGVPTVWEGNSGIRHASVPVTLSEPAPAPITVTFDTPGSDDDSSGLNSCNDITHVVVSEVTTTITFKTNQQSKYAMVPVHGDTIAGAPDLTVVDNTTIVSGTAIVAPPSDIVVVDDDTADTTPPSPPDIGTYRVSEPADGSDPTYPPVVADPTIGCGYPQSTIATVSGDGRYVAFTSNADNLVSNDANGYNDAFVKDTWTGDIERVSVSADGTQGDGDSQVESISADGRYVAFFSEADNLVPGDDNSWYDSFLYDRATGDIERLADIHTFHHGVRLASVSDDGRYVALEDQDTATSTCASCVEVVVLDRTTDTMTLASTGPDGPMTSAGWPAISGDGRHVAFIGIDGSGPPEAYVKDLDTGTLEMVSVNNAGQPAGGGIYGTYPIQPSLNVDGSRVTFEGQYCNMGLPSHLCGDAAPYNIFEVWMRNRVTQTTALVSVATDGTPIGDSTEGASISADGAYVLFAGGLPDPDCQGRHIYERDLSTGITTRVDVISAAVPCPADSPWLTNEALSADGSVATYTSLLSGYVSASNPEAVYVTRLR